VIQNQDWKLLYKIGAIAALVAVVLFRRNFGAEVSLFTGIEAIPQSAAEWYALLQSDPFVGLSFLAVFDLFNYVLVGVLFLALGVAFWRMHKNLVVLALAGGLVGITINLASNISLSMFSLSQQYAVATSEAQKAALLTAGQALLATNNPLATFRGTGTYMSVLLIALAGLLFSLTMLRSNRATAIVGLLASACDLAYCLTAAFAPSIRALWSASAGLFWVIWHLLVARILFKCAKE
jgi:hypothetical protein